MHDAGHKKQQHKAELVGWFVGCFSNHTLHNYAASFCHNSGHHSEQHFRLPSKQPQ
jgi:hypothetical protein